MRSPISIAWLGLLGVGWISLWMGCATTSHDTTQADATWRRDAAPSPAHSATADPLPVYVARFGLADRTAATYPELREAGTGLGLGSRIADGLWESGRFRFLEEKAQMASRLTDLDERTENLEPRVPDEAQHVLYGEIVEVTTRRSERLPGLSGQAETTTEVTVQLRLVDRIRREAIQANGSGRSTVKTSTTADRLDARAVGDATEEAVRRAVHELLQRMGGLE